MRNRLTPLLLFAVAMAFVEAAVVVYLRRVLGGGAIFPMKVLPPPLMGVELAREAATLVMLATVAILFARGGARRMGAFLLLFAVWDVFYYAWLYAAIRWPAGPGEWDILFLIPAPWVGPVWSVLLICVGMAVFAVPLLMAPEGAPFVPGAWGWGTGIAGAALTVAAYILEWRKIGYGHGVPDRFSLFPYLAGVALLGLSGYVTVRRSLRHGIFP